MKLNVDDWNFRAPALCRAAPVEVELFLSNGQRAMLEVLPLANPLLEGESDQIPEVRVRAEASGERLEQGDAVLRWLTRPLDRDCRWSRVELPESLVCQVNERLGVLLSGPPEPVLA